jgi:hypothetical protein
MENIVGVRTASFQADPRRRSPYSSQYHLQRQRFIPRKLLGNSQVEKS